MWIKVSLHQYDSDKMDVPTCTGIASRGGRLSDSIGNLLHLRYIDLSWSPVLEMLPESVTNLHLQTLILCCCMRLTALPKDFSKLVNLRLLDVWGTRLTRMPSGMAMAWLSWLVSAG